MPKSKTSAEFAVILMGQVDTSGQCWMWRGHIDPSGYGRITVSGNRVYAHRAVYELLVAPIPEDLVVDHLCMVKGCVNPMHLEAVTNDENVRRYFAVRQWPTHCKAGHEMSEGNYYVRRKPNGEVKGRQCKTCHAKHTADHRARKDA